MKRVLIIVDPQYDFIEGGKLPVKGGEKALAGLVKYLSIDAGLYDNIIVTQD